jgi:putative transposase
MVTGWQLATHMRTSLITDALAMAIAHGHIRPGAVFHSDRGAQPGFKGSSQHRLAGPSIGIGRGPRLASSSRGSCGGGC